MYCRSRSPAETQAFACRLARAIDSAGLVIALRGPLGAGKTVFARGLAEGLGVDPEQVTSPSFVIASHHAGGALPFVHADLYRIESVPELEAAGWLDWIAPGTVVAVEWADRFPGALPGDHLAVSIARPATAEAPAQAGAGQTREIVMEAKGPHARRALARALGSGEDSVPRETPP